MAFEFDQKKMVWIGLGAVVVIFILSKLVGKDKSAQSEAPPTGVISNIGPSGQDVNERYALQAQSQLATQQTKLAGLGALLDYSTANKTLDTQYALGLADLTNTTAIKNKELDTSLSINRQNVESQNLLAQYAMQTALGVAGIEAGAQEAAIAGQVQIAGIAAGVESERTKADLTLGLRGYDSKDYETASNEKLGLAQIDLEKFGISEGSSLQRYLADIGLQTRKKELKTDRQISRIEANRDTTLSSQQTNAQIQIAKIQRPSVWDNLFGALGSIFGGAGRLAIP